ncbi:psbP domain-containing protein 4, chloroplastic-like [Papaver somniferum]|uniref:psbP domain-containing protein 4, chloroplastic-like n=1 Tax=Papaver somniferum TaxID=3469 RepID=UPI000E6F877C|nr:psbP domain-containing protein 4, chloroplastic-like [Papaver somniferum]
MNTAITLLTSSSVLKNGYCYCSSALSRRKASLDSNEDGYCVNVNEKNNGFLKRREALVSGVSLVSSSVLMGSFPSDGLAVIKQGLLAGRVPGLSDPDEQGWRTYRRPDAKSGGHGVGWSPIIPYTFSVPQGWEEVPVSIADLGGTEIDLRFASSQAGRLFVIVAPVLRFSSSLGDDVNIEMVGTPDKVISAFGPEVTGENVEGKVLSTEVAEHSGRKYYQYELETPHVLMSTTAAGNRLYIFAVTANGLQWRKHYQDLKRISTSFRVV